jgi:NMD protein affecting ribosome stability and mRNA decay
MRNSRVIRNDKLIKEKRHDAFPKKGDWAEPTQCTICGSTYTKGRWTWEIPEGKASHTTCPACRRISKNYPAGYVEIRGSFFEEHEDEILNLVHNIEKIEKKAHPLERIMFISPDDKHTLITTTGIHIARRIGEAISRAYQGDMSFQYADGEKRIRVYWERD